jgi:methionyl-tRNA synthetase
VTQNSFYITTPIYYVNDRPHIGHAYTSIACDVLARFHRLSGDEVKFLTGTDEHGQKIEKSANNAGIAPKEFVDSVSVYFRDMGKLLNLSNDDFIRTTEPRHIKAAQDIWKRMMERGHIYLGSYAGWYAVSDEAYYQESEIVDGKAPSGSAVEWVEEPSYFFDLSKWEAPLLKFYEENPDFIAPASRRNEIISFVKGGLKDLSISRTTFKWGIPVPSDEKHVMYVWLDALTNYLSALGYPDMDAKDYKQFWPANVHMVGKDIIRFHCVYWPAFLMAADLPLPKRVFAHGWWTIEGQKISKSLGNAISATDLVAEYGLDQMRYFLLREVPFGNDGDFSRERVKVVINSELANTIGNLVQRVLAMVQKNCGGVVPDYRNVELREEDKAFIESFLVTKPETPDQVRRDYFDCNFHKILGSIVQIAASANEYIDKQAPWTLKKVNPEQMNAVLYFILEGIRCIAIYLQPTMPEASTKILDQLAVPPENRSFASVNNFEFMASGKLSDSALKPGTALPAPSPIFPRIETAKDDVKVSLTESATVLKING